MRVCACDVVRSASVIRREPSKYAGVRGMVPGMVPQQARVRVRK